MGKLWGENSLIGEGKVKGMDFVSIYLRMKHVIVFKLTHGVLQVRLASLLFEKPR